MTKEEANKLKIGDRVRIIESHKYAWIIDAWLHQDEHSSYDLCSSRTLKERYRYPRSFLPSEFDSATEASVDDTGRENSKQEEADSISNELIVVARNIIDKNFPKEKSKSRGMALLTSALLTMEFAKYIAENYTKKPNNG